MHRKVKLLEEVCLIIRNQMAVLMECLKRSKVSTLISRCFFTLSFDDSEKQVEAFQVICTNALEQCVENFLETESRKKLIEVCNFKELLLHD